MYVSETREEKNILFDEVNEGNEFRLTTAYIYASFRNSSSWFFEVQTSGKNIMFDEAGESNEIRSITAYHKVSAKELSVGLSNVKPRERK